MNTDNDLKQLFTSQRATFDDDDFAREVIHRLPRRPSYLQPIILGASFIIALTLIVVTEGFGPFTRNVADIVLSLSRLEWPSTTSVTAYAALLLCIGIFGYGAAESQA
jgi:hypothetical protein